MRNKNLMMSRAGFFWNQLKKWMDMKWLKQNWLKVTLIVFTACLMLVKDLQFQIDLRAPMGQDSDEFHSSSVAGNAWFEQGKRLGTRLIGAWSATPVAEEQELTVETLTTQNEEEAGYVNVGNTYSNMTYHKPQKKVATAISKKVARQNAYVDRFAHVAQAEMKKFGIPASITLAQGLVESNAGDSRLSREINNHFGMKCFSRTCKKGHCKNFMDDTHKDFFRAFGTAWESFRAHSQMLKGKRYRHLQQYGNDYRAWARGLKKAGYATDPKYAEKLIHVIETLKLNQYDEL